MNISQAIKALRGNPTPETLSEIADMLEGMGWQPIETAPKDRQFWVLTEGLLIREIPDWQGFFSGCDNGPDIIEKTIPLGGHVAWFEEGKFYTDDGEVYDETTFVVEDMSLPPDEIEGDEHHKDYRMTAWCELMPLPAHPELATEGN